MNINLKVILAFIYIICLSTLLYLIFSYLDLKDLTSYAYIKNNTQILLNFKNNNILLLVILFFLGSAVWVFMLGFGSPICILSGFLFGQWVGTLISVASLTLGSSFLYFFARYYFADIIVKRLSNRIIKYKYLFNKNEFFYFMAFRFAGGAGIPFAIQNIIPVVFNMKLKNYIYATFFGLVPSVFIINTLGNGIENIIKNNERIDYKSFLFNPEIYWPLIGFVLIIFVSHLIKLKLFKK